jgi:hypothetical protein
MDYGVEARIAEGVVEVAERLNASLESRAILLVALSWEEAVPLGRSNVERLPSNVTRIAHLYDGVHWPFLDLYFNIEDHGPTSIRNV